MERKRNPEIPVLNGFLKEVIKMNTLKLRMAANAIHIAAPLSVARELSEMLTWAANTIDTMQKQTDHLAGIVKILTKALAEMEEKIECLDNKGDKNEKTRSHIR